MNTYYINCTLGDGIPDYNFVLKAESHDLARDEAWKIFETDYPEVSMIQRQINSKEITAEQLLEELTLN